MNKTHEITHIYPGKASSFLDAFRSKELLYFFAWRTFKVRYKQASLGIVWSVLQPLLFAGVIGLVIARRAGLSFGYEGFSDIIVVFLGFSLWQFFQGSYSGAIGSINANKGLSKKVYIPPPIIVISPILSRLVDLGIQVVVFLALSLIVGNSIPLIGIPAILIAVTLLALSTLGLGLFFAPINVKYRDVTLSLPFITRLLFFTTPIWYPMSLIPDSLLRVLLYSPPVACIEFVRTAFFTDSPNYSLLVYPVITVTVFLVAGIWMFKKQEARMADYF